MADVKISGLTAGTRTKRTDLLETVQDVAGTPISRKMAVENLIPSPDYPPVTAATEDDEFDAGSLDAKWTWVNQGTATVSFSQSVASLRALAAAGVNVKGLVQTAPATSWTITGKFNYLVAANASFNKTGLLLGDASTKLVGFGFGWDGAPRLQAVSFSSPTAFNSTYVSNALAAGSWHYLRITDNGTNLIYSVSFDGLFWLQVLSHSRTTYFASGPTKVGFMAASENGGSDVCCNCDWFRKT